MKLLQSSWVTALIGGLLYLGVTVALIHPSQFEGAHAAQAPAVEKSPDDDPSWRFRNPEIDQWIAELKREKEALDLREQQLQELALRLDAERKELTAITQTVYQIQSEFDKNIIRIKDQEMENLKRQAKVFANMEPDTVAALVNEMPEDESVRILFVMKNDDVIGILERLGKLGPTGSRRAASITEKLRRVLPPDKAKPKTY